MNQTTSFGLWRFSREYLSAAVLVGADPKYEISSVRYYLLGHSAELMLKAFLLANGVPLEELKTKIGHDLERALERAKSLGLLNLVSIPPQEDYSVRLLSKTYKLKEHEYIVTGYREWPQPALMVSFIERILMATQSICVKNTIAVEAAQTDDSNQQD